MPNSEENQRYRSLPKPVTVTALAKPAYDFPDQRWDRGSADPAQDGLLLEYYRLLRRRRGIIAVLALAGALLGFATTVWRLPVYRARTSLDIQNLNDNFLNRGEVALTSDGRDSSEESRVQTQIKLLQSDTLRKRTVKRIRAAGAAESIPRNDLFSQWKRMLHLPIGDQLPEEELLQYTAKHVTVKPLGVTRLVEVTCDSYDPKFSADFCNTLTSEFSAQDRDVRMIDAQKTSEYLSRQLLDVREGVAAAEKKLEAATGHDGMILQTGGTVAEQRLHDLQAELMKAQADRIEKESQYDNSLSAAPDSLPIVLDSAAYRDQQTRLADLRHQVATLVPPLTEENPRVKHLRVQIAEAEAAVLVIKHNVVTRLGNEYESAKHREGMLRAAYDEQERKVSAEMTRQNQVSMLRHELESGQQLYQTLLQRVKEAGFAAAMQASTVRVVDAAVLPSTPIAPRYPAAVATGLLLGLIAGLTTAFLKERTQTLLRAPGDAPRYLHLRELGVIPSARSSMRLFSARELHPPSAGAGLVTLAAGAETARRIAASGSGVNLLQNRSSLLAEAYRNATYSVLRTSKPGNSAKVYVVSSPGVGDGKTTVTCNLGVALAQANRRVLVIDGDLRRPRLHTVAGVENNYGLRDVLRAPAESVPATERFCLPTQVENLFILPTGKGREEPSTLLHSPAMSDLLRRLSGAFDLILIDSPPAIHIADARILAGISDGVILVFRARTTPRETAMTARDLFLGDDVEVVGTILNDFDPTREGQDKYYTSYYAYARNEGPASGTDSKIRSGARSK
jgi:succinoglycan biosynthesis transport protein ExoP